MAWKNRFPAQKQAFLLLASASPDKVVPTKPKEEYVTMLESKKEFAKSMVQHGIATQRGGTQVINHALASALYSGNFYNPEGNGAPKGISIFFAVPAPFAGNTSAMSEAELELRLKGKDLITPAHIQALTKSQVQIPNDGYVIRSTLENQLCLLDYIFGKTSHMYIQLEKLLATTKNQQYKRTFDE